MTLTSPTFAGFVALALALYYPLPRRWQNALLLVLSAVFYASWSGWALAVLAAIILINFALGLRLRRDDQPRRALLWAGISANLLALAVLKYERFFVPDLRVALDRWGMTAGPGALDVLLPVGMSFYILGAISYLLDVARGQMDAERDPLDFALYLAYFPKLLAGPIERARSFLPRLAAPRVVDNDALARAAARLVIGAVRKGVFADTLFNALPPGLWDHPQRFDAPQLAGYLLIYAFALYNDFAGYTSLARGVSGLFGIELSANFNTPYLAHSFADFWSRWHRSLTAWLRDYVYFPTSRALLRRSLRRDYLPNLVVPPLLTMLISGLWHGTGWGFLLWGLLHGIYLAGEQIVLLVRPSGLPRSQPRWRQAASTVVVFGLVLLAWVPFRAPSLAAALDYWRGLLDLTGGTNRPSAILLIALIPASALDWVQYRANDELVMLRWPRAVQAALLALSILAVALVAQANTGTPFVYQGF